MMKAMILAAGRGQRMGVLTEETPKPLLTIKGVPLIVDVILQLVKAGVTDVVINLHYKKEKIMDVLGDGSIFGVNITYSLESVCLNTGGGILNALPLLGSGPFIVVSADLFTRYDFSKLPRSLNGLAHLVMVDNPSYHPKGDFALINGKLRKSGDLMLTYASIGVLHADLFKNAVEKIFPLGAFLNNAIESDKVTGEYFSGFWYNVGTPTELAFLNQTTIQQE